MENITMQTPPWRQFTAVFSSWMMLVVPTLSGCTGGGGNTGGGGSTGGGTTTLAEQVGEVTHASSDDFDQQPGLSTDESGKVFIESSAVDRPVEVEVTDENGEPVVGIEVNFAALDGAIAISVVDPTGTYDGALILGHPDQIEQSLQTEKGVVAKPIAIIAGVFILVKVVVVLATVVTVGKLAKHLFEIAEFAIDNFESISLKTITFRAPLREVVDVIKEFLEAGVCAISLAIPAKAPGAAATARAVFKWEGEQITKTLASELADYLIERAADLVWRSVSGNTEVVIKVHFWRSVFPPFTNGIEILIPDQGDTVEEILERDDPANGDDDASVCGNALCESGETISNCPSDCDNDGGSGLEIVKQSQVDTGGYASGIALSPDESKVYVAYWEDENSSRVQEFSLPDLALLQTFTFGSYHTHGDVVVSGDGTRIFTTNYYHSSISQVDLTNGNSRTDLSTVDTWPASIAITPDKNKVLVGVGQDGRDYDMGNDSIAIYDINGGTFSLLSSVVLQDEPRGHSFGVSQDSRFAYIATRKLQSSNPKLYEVSLESPFEVTRTLDFPEASYELVYTRSLGDHVYVSDPENSKIWVVDRSSWTKTGYALESAPAALEVHPSGEYVFVLMPEIGSVVAIDVASMSIAARHDGLSSAANDIEFDNDGTKMYIAHRSSVGEIMVFDLSW